MTRPLLTLGGGIVLAVLAAALLAGPRDLRAVLGPVLVTTAVGALVFGVVARRAAHRRRLEDLQTRTDRTTTQEPDRG